MSMSVVLTYVGILIKEKVATPQLHYRNITHVLTKVMRTYDKYIFYL